MKKTISIILFIVLLLTPAVSALAGNSPTIQSGGLFNDVPTYHWAYMEIMDLAQRGIINGYDDGTYRPDNPVTRGEWAKLMVETAGIRANDYGVYHSDTSGHWALRFINAASDYLPGFDDGSYLPDEAVLREDVTVALVMLNGFDTQDADLSFLNRFSDMDSITENAKSYVAIAVELELIGGFDDGTFRGQETLDRAQAAVLLWRSFIDTLPYIADTVIPGNGGIAQVDGTTDYTFTPDSTGLWEISTSENTMSDPYLILFDSDDEIISEDDDGGYGLNAHLFSWLIAGETYTIRAGFYSGRTGNYLLTVELMDTDTSIPSNGGETIVSEPTLILFTPDESGLWIFTTSNSDYSDPYLYIYNINGNMLGYDDDSGGYLDAMIVIYLEAGELYLVGADYYYYTSGSYTLSATLISISETIPAGGGEIRALYSDYYGFTPDNSGLWIITVRSEHGLDTVLNLYSEDGELVAYPIYSISPDADIITFLEEGQSYIVHAGIWDNAPDEYILDVSPITIVGTIPTAGGEVLVNGSSFYEFTPSESGYWVLATSDNGDSDPFLWIYDQEGEVVDYNDDAGFPDLNSRLITRLEVGETYYIHASFYDDIGSYTLTVAPPQALPSSGGEIRVDGEMVYSFTPNQSGVWEFRTLNSGDFDPFIGVMSDDYSVNEYADDNAGGFEAIVSVYLEAGTVYDVYVGFWWDEVGSTTLRVTFRP